MKNNRDSLFLVVSVIIVVIACDLIMPFIYNHVKTDHFRTTLMLKKLQDTNFKPEVMVFGSSASMCGIDCYQMTNELGLECYNFSSTGQPQEESSLFFSLLPNSVKAVIQVIEVPVRDASKKDEDEKGILPQLGNTIMSSFVLGGYKIDQETKHINKYLDLSDFDKNKYLVSMDARASIVIPALTQWLVPRDKAAAEDLKYPNAYFGTKHKLYDRTVKQALKHSLIGKKIVLNENSLYTLNNYAKFLKKKSIDYYVVLMPVNPDSKRYSREQSEWIAKQITDKVSEARVFDFLNLFHSAEMFYDGEHINRDGARILTGLLDDNLKKKGILTRQ